MARVLDGALVLEEYPAAQPVAVLNGWIFALFGVHELAVVGGDERARDLFDESFAGLQSLPHGDIQLCRTGRPLCAIGLLQLLQLGRRGREVRDRAH